MSKAKQRQEQPRKRAHESVFAVHGSRAAKSVVFVLVFAFLLQPVSFIYANENDSDAGEVVQEVKETKEVHEPETESKPKTEPEPGPAVEQEHAQDTESGVEVTDEVESETETETSAVTQPVDDKSAPTEVDEHVEVEGVANIEQEVSETDTQSDTQIKVPGEQDGSGLSSRPNISSSSSSNSNETGGTKKSSTTSAVLGTTTTPSSASSTSVVPADSADASESQSTSTTESVGTTTNESVMPETAETSEGVEDAFEETFEDDVLDQVLNEAEDGVQSATSTENQNEIQAETKSASTTSASSTPQIIYVTATGTANNAQNRHQFAESECVHVGEGAFYCAKADGTKEQPEDEVYSAPDKDGDHEIYVRIDGEVEQITDNTRDDTAPYYDEVGEQIVWHALENDRYQIFVFDLKSGETKQLTNESYNSMEPTAYDDTILWQAWVGDNWEVMMHVDGETIQLTNNAHHDVAPHVRGGYIVWQAQLADTWYVKIYDRETEVIETIEGDGSLIENPRFLLVYDSTKENGDTETIGYDLKSKKAVPLSRIPTSVPEKLPDPERTGEERALLNTKTQASKEVLEEQDGQNGDGKDDGTSATSKQNKNSTSTASTTQHTTSSSTDIAVPALSTTTETHSAPATASTSTEHIEDVIIDSLLNKGEEAPEGGVHDEDRTHENASTSTKELRSDLVVPTYSEKSEDNE